MCWVVICEGLWEQIKSMLATEIMPVRDFLWRSAQMNKNTINTVCPPPFKLQS